MLGCTREEYASRQLNIMDSLYPVSRKILENALLKAVKTGEETQCELQVFPISSDKCDLWLLNRIRFLSQNAGNSIFYIAVENITQNRELEKVRLRLNDIVNNVPAGIAIYEWDTKNIDTCKWVEQIKPIYISDKVCELFGFTHSENNEKTAELITKKFWPNIDDYSSENFERLCAGEPIETVLPADKKDGSAFWLRAVTSVTNHGGHPSLIYATLFDVTTQYEADEELGVLINFLPGVYLSILTRTVE